MQWEDAGKGNRFGVFPSITWGNQQLSYDHLDEAGFFLLWILAQSLWALVLQVFWDEVGVWRPLWGWLLTFLAKGLLPFG